jgi:flagellar basal-body rod protein FlgB
MELNLLLFKYYNYLKKECVMGIEVSRTSRLAKEALNYRAARQDMISSNIANADTPFYRPRDIRFEDALAAKKAEILKNTSNELKMAKTDSAHLEPDNNASMFKATTFFRDGHMARNDGNSVDLDVETTEMAKNSTMYNALISTIKKRFFDF